LVGNAAAHNDEVPIDCRGRSVAEMAPVAGPANRFSQVHLAGAPEAPYRPSRLGIKGDNTPAGGEKDPALAVIGPRCDATMDEPDPMKRCTWRKRPGIVSPDLRAGASVGGDHAVVGRGEIQHATDHDRRGLEAAGVCFPCVRPWGIVRALARAPEPGPPQIFD